MIPFHKPWSSGEELTHVARALASQGGPDARFFTQACERWLESHAGAGMALLTPSCTAALEMAALLCGLQPGDEVIMASFTFPAMANAFVLRGAVPVFVDIRPDTLNIDERLVEQAIGPRTRAIVAMHYGGVACEMDSLMALAERHGLMVIEDAAHALGATYRGRPLGSIGHLGAFSFHSTKNIQCGEGGALLVNDRRLMERAEIVREHGTDRARFRRGETPGYRWVDIGSSFIMSEFSAAFLLAQLQHLGFVLGERRRLWRRYQQRLGRAMGEDVSHSAHIFAIAAASADERQALIDYLRRGGVQAASHYQPLHATRAGRRYTRQAHALRHTERTGATLLRLPLWTGMTEDEVDQVCDLLRDRPASPGTASAGMAG